jgi:hypothetical protein
MIQKSTYPVSVFLLSMIFCSAQAQPDLSIYNVVWESPSLDATGQMPPGNGDIAAGVYAIEKNAFTYNGDIFKAGRVKIPLNPNPIIVNRPLKQILDLHTGSVLIEADGTNIRVHAICQQERDINKWIGALQDQANRQWDVSREWQLHCEWWKEFWGRRFTFQNRRLFYWSLPMSGNSDLMKPFFDYCWNLSPLRREITKAWFGHEGAYFRENLEPTGGERDCGQSADKESHMENKPLKTPPGENEGSGFYHSYYFTSVTKRVNWKRFRSDIPEIHLREIDGKNAIAPALEWAMMKNSGNGRHCRADQAGSYPYQCLRS